MRCFFVRRSFLLSKRLHLGLFYACDIIRMMGGLYPITLIYGDVMRIAIIDADLIGRTKHRFPNLACEKISGYYKTEKHADVVLKLDYENLL